MLSNAGLLKGDGDIEGSRNESTDALTELVSPNNDVEIKIKQPVTMSSLGNRMGGSRSMTGLDVYGPMTIGDDQDEALRGVEAPNQSVDYQVRRTMDSDSGFVFSQPDRFPKR